MQQLSTGASKKYAKKHLSKMRNNEERKSVEN